MTIHVVSVKSYIVKSKQGTSNMEILDTKQAAEYLKHKESTLETWRSTGKGPVWYKPGGKVLYYKTDLDEWIKEGENK